jgi:uncharacterized protein (DUF433 family)
MSSAIKPQPKILANRVTSTPGVCGGRPCIAGHRIRIFDIYVMHGLQGRTTDEILKSYPTLSRADVEAAIAYYLNHQGNMEQESLDEDNLVAEMKKKLGPGPLAAKRLQQKN